MKKLTWLCTLLFALLLGACTDKAKLSVTNLTTARLQQIAVDTKVVSLEVGQTYQKSWDLQKGLLSSESRTVKVSTLSQPYLFARTRSYNLDAGDSKHVDIEFDAGMFSLTNMLPATVTGMYISADTDNWGDNLLASGIAYNEQREWNITPGIWNIKLERSDYEISYYLEQTFVVGETITKVLEPRF